MAKYSGLYGKGGGERGEAESMTSLSSCGISSRASSQSVRRGASDNLLISRFLSPLRSGDFQLISQLLSQRDESLGAAPSNRVSGTDARDVLPAESERVSRMGAGNMSPSSILLRTLP